MKFAIIDGDKAEATKGATGFCQSCGAEVIAKCGTQKIWHWAHKRKTDCDHWWESETEWHRRWKNNYSADWQEISLLDERTGEKHIADVRTVYDLIIEFQHSRIDPQERIKREKFYKNMIWVVDATRLKKDYPRFVKGKKNSFENQIFYKTDNPKIFRVDLIDWCFPLDWLESSVPVIFDFLGDGSLDDSDGLRNNLYCLFPQIGSDARVAEISRKVFIDTTTNGQWTLRVQKFMNDWIEQKKIQAQEWKEKENQVLKKQRTQNGYEFSRKLLAGKSPLKRERKRF